jgi:signal transduction histidine kinase
MNLFAISGILGVATSAIMAALMFVRGKNKTHVIWGFFCLSVVLWDLGVSLFASTSNQISALLWWKIALLGIIFIPVTFNHFVYIFLEKKNRILIYSSYAISAALSIILMVKTDYLLSLKWDFDQFFYNSNPGAVYIFLTIFFFFLIGWGHYQLIKAYSKSSGIKKLQLKYFFIGTLIGFSGGSFNFLPAYGVNLYPFLNFTIVLYPLIIGYSIIKHRLMDIRIVIRSFFIYLDVLIFCFLFFFLFVVVGRKLFGDSFGIDFYKADWVLIPALVFIVYITDKLSRKIANKYFFFGLYNYQSTINNLSKKLNNYIDLNKISNSIVFAIINTMQVSRVGVILVSQNKGRTDYQAVKIVGFNKAEALKLISNSFLSKYLKQTQSPLVQEELSSIAAELKGKNKQEDFYHLNLLMQQAEVSLCLPLLSNNKLIGIIILGLKVSGDAYSKEELELLSTLSFQAGIAISNAQYYKEVKDFNSVLQEKVDQQTRELKARSRALETQNIKLNKLLAMKNEFLRLVNHQLNTPISIIKNATYMLHNKQFDEEKGISFINEGIRRIEGVLNDFWKAFAVEGDGVKLNYARTDLPALINKLVESSSKLPTAIDKKLMIRAVNKKPIPAVKTDPVQLSQVISNLLDNAIAYTPSGSITVSLDIVRNNLVKVTVADTGYGIDKKDQHDIFEKFFRGNRAKQYRPGGSGLGLYIAKKIISANGGELKLEKSEVGKGSTFSFTVPTWK